MADSVTHPDGETTGPERGSTSGTPRWVKVSFAIALILAVLLVIGLFTGVADHRADMH